MGRGIRVVFEDCGHDDKPNITEPCPDRGTAECKGVGQPTQLWGVEKRWGMCLACQEAYAKKHKPKSKPEPEPTSDMLDVRRQMEALKLIPESAVKPELTEIDYTPVKEEPKETDEYIPIKDDTKGKGKQPARR